MVATGFGFVERESNGVQWCEVVGLGDSDRLLAAVSTRHGGVSSGDLGTLNVGALVGDQSQNVRTNRERLFRALSVDERRVSYVRQIHGCRVFEPHDDSDTGLAGRAPIEADAQMTDRSGVCLFLTFADCVPILVYDPDRHVVGVAHAGWRGTVAEVGISLVEAMSGRFGCRPADIRAAIGPSIGGCCYAVGDDVAREFQRRWPEAVAASRTGPGGWTVDLSDANRRQLIRAGLQHANVYVTRVCTACRVGQFYSHRGQTGRAGRFAAVAMLR